MMLFINSILTGDTDKIFKLAMILAIFYMCVLVAIFIDLASGIEKAKRNNILRTSHGFKKTIYKIRDYFSVLMLFTLSDVVASVWFSLPFFTAVGTVFIIFVEAKSVYENKRDVNKGIRDLPDVLFHILKDKGKSDELIKILKDDYNNKNANHRKS